MKRFLAVACLLAGTNLSFSIPAAHAQTAREAELVNLHVACGRGERAACVRFGMMIEQNRVMLASWRRSHADWFWFEH